MCIFIFELIKNVINSGLLIILFTGLFQKAIMQSGCIFNSWALRENHKQIALKFAKYLGCQKDDPKEIVQYLLNVPAFDLVKSTTLGVRKQNHKELLNTYVVKYKKIEMCKHFIVNYN